MLRRGVTNNQAEYCAAITGVQNGMRFLSAGGDLELRGDSDLVVKQLLGEMGS